MKTPKFFLLKTLGLVFSVFLFMISLTGCYRDEDVLPSPPPRNYDITNVTTNVTMGGDTINIKLYAPVSVNSPVMVNLTDNSKIIVHGSTAYAVSHSSTYNLIDQSGQSTPVTVYFAPGAISFNNQVYAPVTVNSPVHVNLTDSSKVIVYGDKIFNVINVDARTFVDLSGQSTVVDVYFAEGAISFNNEVYLVNENNNEWAFNSDDDVWINVEGDTITQNQMVGLTFDWVWNTTVNVVDLPSVGDPENPDTVFVRVGTTLVPLDDHRAPSATKLSARAQGQNIVQLFAKSANLNIAQGTGDFGLFLQMGSINGFPLFWAVRLEDTVGTTITIKLFSPLGDSVEMAIAKVNGAGNSLYASLTTTSEQRQFAYTLTGSVPGFPTTGLVRPNDFAVGVNRNPTIDPVDGVFIVKDPNNHGAAEIHDQGVPIRPL